jgi:hypothetical protein
MGALEDLGVTVQASFHTSSLSAGGVQLSGTEKTRLTITLPRPTPLRASFRKESWGDAVVKVFKKELQTGDAAFDALVYISTDTPSETAAFLSSEGTRKALAEAVEDGGPVEIEGARVVAHTLGHDTTHEDRAILALVRALLAL